MERFLQSIAVGWCFLLASLAPCFAQAAQELGIDRSNLTTQSEAAQEKTLSDIRNLHATWFRDALNRTTPQAIASTVNEVKLVKQHGLKMIAIIMPSDVDFDHPYASSSAEMNKSCGWAPVGKLSEINLSKFSRNIGAMLDALKAARLTIETFEIGSELDTMCYDPDVPIGHFATESEIATWVRGYGEFLKAAALVIRDPRHYPQAKIITFGMAHGSDQWDKPTRHFSNPASVLARLRNVNGFNYFDNAQYHIDGYGTHVYPWAGNIAGSVRNTMRQDAASLSDKPIWVTEFGFLSHASFPTPKGQSLEQGLQEMLDTFDSLASHTSFGPLMFYAYNGWLLIDNSGRLQPEADVLSGYAKTH
jgi:hypothetical protein